MQKHVKKAALQHDIMSAGANFGRAWLRIVDFNV